MKKREVLRLHCKICTNYFESETKDDYCEGCAKYYRKDRISAYITSIEVKPKPVKKIPLSTRRGFYMESVCKICGKQTKEKPRYYRTENRGFYTTCSPACRKELFTRNGKESWHKAKRF